MFFFLMLRRPPRSTRTDHSFPTRRSSDLHTKGGRSIQHMSGTGYIHPVKGFAVPMPGAGKTGQVIYMLAIPHGFQNTSGIQQVPGEDANTCCFKRFGRGRRPGQSMYLMPLIRQPECQVFTDKTSSSCNENSHTRSEEHTSELQSLK